MHHAHLSKDKKLQRIMTIALEEIKPRPNVALRLIASIMAQQLSVRVAQVLYQRFLDLYNGKEPTAKMIMDTAPEKLRAIGLSNAKVQYVLNVARFVVEEKVTDAKLHAMADDEVINYLTQIKGVGRWTVEMLLMFQLGREDVFALDDLGLQNAMIKLYKLDATDKKAFKEKLVKITAKWSPYRTYAARYLWAWRDDDKQDNTPK
ncbi:DNA-3-methyladenine glycosylase 2 family protein [Chitinophaga parva]|uniref:DNA-3-methyladenine glycosylase II n=1 Tax=Chitinophaga parva TaxID=2169414 RepID=A0A2T7BKX4_9BACT|nr:DNA-3-methyladenine glycosylase [Chitinophaga parva]PUZ28325.1 DNA-3-methyladenine glycosylase 2 family protein [Chitinophaga parva]